MLGTHSLNSILGLDSNTRLPSISSSINQIKGTSGQPILIDEGVQIKTGIFFFDKFYVLYKYREFSLLLSIKESLYIITEAYQNGKKIGLDLPVVKLEKPFNKFEDAKYSQRSIFIYRGEEDSNAKKEVCVLYSMLVLGQTINTITCYQYGTWKITRGPFEFLFNFMVYKKELNMYQSTNGSYFIVYDLLNYVVIDSALTRVVTILKKYGIISSLSSPQKLLCFLNRDVKEEDQVYSILELNQTTLTFEKYDC
jgi:hypothetical protein